MSKTGKNNQTGMNIALGVLLVTWIVLLVLLILIYIMRLQGYDTFHEWLHRNEHPTMSSPDINQTPVPGKDNPETLTPVPTVPLTPTLTPTPVITSTPTPTPPFLMTLSIAGDEGIDGDIRQKAIAFAGDANVKLAYETYTLDNYLSVVFHKAGRFEEEKVDLLLPLVYDLTTKEQVMGSDLMKESYFAIIKERLQTYVAENVPSSIDSEFITYMEVYQEEDYQQFYLTEESLVFWFEENTLLSEGQKPFAYAVPLEEAKAFFHYNLDGSKAGIAIRELDPNAKMVAFTFDDGPHLVRGDMLTNNDLKLIELFLSYDGRATFFFLGNRIDGTEAAYGEIARRAYHAGFEVASHTYSHEVDFGSAKTSRKEIMWKEFNATNRIIAEATGHAPDYVRLPGGSAGIWTKEFPVPIINWDKDSIDYKYKNKSNGATTIYNRLLDIEIEDGSIVLLHSIYNNSYEATEKILKYLDEQGFLFVTVSELFYYKGITLEDGTVYKHAVIKEATE